MSEHHGPAGAVSRGRDDADGSAVRDEGAGQPLVAADAGAPGGQRTSSVNPWPLLGVLVFFAIGVALVATRHWRRGSVMIGGSLVLAGILRLVLPVRVAGLLVVRHRAFDVALALGAGSAMMVLGLVVPGVYVG